MTGTQYPGITVTLIVSLMMDKPIETKEYIYWDEALHDDGFSLGYESLSFPKGTRALQCSGKANIRS